MAKRFGNRENRTSDRKKDKERKWVRQIKLGSENRRKKRWECENRKDEKMNCKWSRRKRKKEVGKPLISQFLCKSAKAGSIWLRIGTSELVDRRTTCSCLTYRDEIPLFRYHGSTCDLESRISAFIPEEHCRWLVRLALRGARKSATRMKSNCAKWGNRSLKRYETSLQISELGQIKSIALVKLPIFTLRK